MENKLLRFIEKKRFVTRGAPFAKKMWRDGYNKALLDIRNFILMGDSSADPDPEATDKP